MNRRTIVILGVALGLASLAFVAWSQERAPGGAGPAMEGGPDEGPGHPPLGHMLAMLDNDEFKSDLRLTDAQADRLRQILVDAQKTSLKTGAEMGIRGIELREMLRAEKPDHDAVMKKVQEISNLRADLMRQHVETLLAAKTVLTPEQQKRIRSWMESRRGGEAWRGRFRERGWGMMPPGAETRPAPQVVRPGEPPVE